MIELRPRAARPFFPILNLIVVLALIRGILYASLVPPWQAPDEPGQFERARAALMGSDWRSTSKDSPAWYNDLVQSLFTFNFWDFVVTPRLNYSPDLPPDYYIAFYQEIYDGLYGSRPAYAVIGWPLLLFRSDDITLQLYLLRLNTIFMNIGVIILAYLITRLIFPEDQFLMLGVPIVILFNPQHTHLLATVNNGNLAELLTTVALYFLIKGIVKGFTWFRVIGVVFFSLAAMWTKATAYFLPFAVGSVGLFYSWQFRRYWFWFLPIGTILIGLIYIFAPQRLKILLFQAWTQMTTGNFYLNPIVPVDLFRSFWAMPGWMIVKLNPFWYGVLACACLLAVMGLAKLLLTKRELLFSSELRPRLQALLVLGIAAVVAIGVLLSWNTITGSVIYRQARSIYPAIVPISLFLVLGWRELIPSAGRNFGLLAITTLLFLFDTLVLFGYIIPFFYSRY